MQFDETIQLKLNRSTTQYYIRPMKIYENKHPKRIMEVGKLQNPKVCNIV